MPLLLYTTAGVFIELAKRYYTGNSISSGYNLCTHQQQQKEVLNNIPYR
jgi:hypothetical protein